MLIDFSPPLGETLNCRATRNHSSVIRLHFTASLSSAAEYAEQLGSGQVRLQVWSDIPGNGRQAGEWGETDFAPSSTPLNEEEEEYTFSLLYPDAESTERARDTTTTTLAAGFSVPVSDSHGQQQQRFSFTYRMLFPSGETKWLGQYGQNGTLVLELDSQYTQPVLLGKEWVSSSTGDQSSYRRDSGDGTEVQGLEVAKLSQPEDYVSYFVGENSPRNSPLLILVPVHPVIAHPTLLFAATSSGSLSLTHGSITMSGTPSLSFTACDAGSLVEAIPAFESTARVIAHSPEHLILASAPDDEKAAVQVTITAVPTVPARRALQAAVPLRTLASLLPGTEFFAFWPPQPRARFFSPSGDNAEKMVHITTGPAGGQFVLAAAHAVAPGWVGVVTAPTQANSNSNPNNKAAPLPTPPPSPRLRPLPHRVSDTGVVVAQSPDPSFLSLPAAISSSSSAASASASGSQLVVHGASGHRAGVLAMIGRVFVVLLAWIARLFHGAGRGGGSGESRSPRAHERTPLLRDGRRESEPEPETATVVVVEAPVPPPQVQVASSSEAVSFDVGEGLTTLLFHGAATHWLKAVPIELNGRALELATRSLGDDLFMAEFSSASGGSLKIQ
ncbi:hypothetical protein C8R46DRAFT_1217228 [Mycena filopes]|nr:hypothetical protein C8R46DRAFT_1217228 [Mycena filopes]